MKRPVVEDQTSRIVIVNGDHPVAEERAALFSDVNVACVRGRNESGANMWMLCTLAPRTIPGTPAS
jgi:hypothetical protein